MLNQVNKDLHQNINQDPGFTAMPSLKDVLAVNERTRMPELQGQLTKMDRLQNIYDRRNQNQPEHKWTYEDKSYERAAGKST